LLEHAAFPELFLARFGLTPPSLTQLPARRKPIFKSIDCLARTLLLIADMRAYIRKRVSGDEIRMAQGESKPPAAKMDANRSAESGHAASRLTTAGLRPTRQRVALARLLFAKGDRHLSAEQLHLEAHQAGMPVSLATVYNTLNQFTDAGMLRVVAIEGSRTYFDTNTSDHHHFYIEDENRVIDVPGTGVSVANLPEPPEGMEIANVDIVIRLRRKG
jgi:Fur family iron response transcriptional regulator